MMWLTTTKSLKSTCRTNKMMSAAQRFLCKKSYPLFRWFPRFIHGFQTIFHQLSRRVGFKKDRLPPIIPDGLIMNFPHKTPISWYKNPQLSHLSYPHGPPFGLPHWLRLQVPVDHRSQLLRVAIGRGVQDLDEKERCAHAIWEFPELGDPQKNGYDVDMMWIWCGYDVDMMWIWCGYILRIHRYTYIWRCP